MVVNDPKNRFEMRASIDLVAGRHEKVWWLRAKYGHTIPVRCPYILSNHFSLLIAKIGS